LARSAHARLAVLAALIPFALLAWRFDFLCDDAYISFRYSRHLALGEGLRFNLGADPPVEGYSNFLWVVYLALFERLGWDVTLWSRLSSVACGALLVAWVTRSAARRLELGPGRAAACGLFVGTLPPVALWATGGLATMPMALATFGFWERLLGERDRPRGWQAGLFALAACLVRADGAVWVALVGAGAALVWLADARPAALRNALAKGAVVCAAGVAAHVAWRLWTYGDYLPNTARLKAGFSPERVQRGLDYVAAFALTMPSLAVAALAGLTRRARAERAAWLPALVVALGTPAYAVWVGGDFMPMGRFLFPAVPFVVLLFAGALSAAGPRGAAGLTLACVGLSVLAALDLGPLPASVRSRFHFRADRKVWESEVEMWSGMKERAERWALQGRALAHCTSEGESMIFGALGALGYYSGLKAYDTYGLVTPSVVERGKAIPDSSPGHDMRVAPSFFFPQRPTYLGSILTRTGAPLDEGLAERWDDHPYSEMVTVERHPLGVEEGFPEGIELRLLRMHRWE
jgi:arabinofuranosyltransferase